MERITKTHLAYQTIKDMLKTNKYPEYTVSDDIQVLRIALEFNLTISILLYSFEQEYHNDTKKLIEALKDRAIEAYEISNKTAESLSTKENHVGIFAAIRLDRYFLPDFNDKEFLFVLDKIEIPGNLGTIYRTLDSVNCDGIILIDPIAKANSVKTTASARGCNLIIPTISTDYASALKFLQDNNYDIYLGEPELGNDYQAYSYSGKCAIVVGNERFGINPDWYNNKHRKVYIPMDGHQNSLNVGVAASILAYEAYMKRKA